MYIENDNNTIGSIQKVSQLSELDVLRMIIVTTEEAYLIELMIRSR